MVLTKTADDISSMRVRGAGRIARTAALALQEYGASLECKTLAAFVDEMQNAAEILCKTRPTAVSLPNAVRYVMQGVRGAGTLEEAQQALNDRATTFIHDSQEAVQKIADIAARQFPDDAVIMTHCNSQVAIACIVRAHEQGRVREVYATEVRPRNQGYITIQMLSDAGVPVNFIVDSAARSFMPKVDLVITGTDAVTANGAVVNKIGTSQIALCAHEARKPFIVAAETYKFAPRTILGERIPIEERPAEEVTGSGRQLPPGVTVKNPAFDVTPPAYVDLIITEIGAFAPSYAPVVIRDHLGWDISEFQKEYAFTHQYGE
ncbi:ribose 1,5-bisphosphate isomerase [Methanogenium organophilum]|uniref:Ribose 1,5-bisphosphate isomerase n=2 Tax=Methanogenium organophilum TaxID=2199 RepID=A0A9X9S732_METOG|nr:ribose 1,5-bisphosphate isomerase [Methanogenium organophilum]